MTFRLLNNRFSFRELNIHCLPCLYEIFSVDKSKLNTDEKNICFSAIVHLQKAPSSASSENAPLKGENIIIYSNKTF